MRKIPILTFAPLLLAAGSGRGVAQAARIPGLGSISFFVSTASDSARHAFLRGALLLHVFHYEQAAAAFREAQRLDPAMVMAYWGEAMTHTHPVWNQQDVAAARAVLAKLGATREARLARAKTAREKGYLEAVEALYGDGAKAARDTLYARAMEKLAATFPDDDEAQLFHALALLGLNQGVREHRAYMKAAAIAAPVFTRNPSHPGASHYLIHAVDDPEHAALGLEAAARLAKAAPDAGHAQHMTSHIFVALGMWDDVIRANEIAVTVADADARQAGRPPGRCGHYNQWLAYGFLQRQRAGEANVLLRACRQQALAGAQGAGVMPFVFMWARHVIDTEDWTGEAARWDIVADDPMPRALVAFVRALAASRTGNRDGLLQARLDFDRARAELRPELEQAAAGDPGAAELLTQLEVQDLELQALSALASRNPEEGIALLRRAATLEEGMAFAFGPPADKPARELLGEELMRLGRREEARAAFRAALERYPGRLQSRRGLEAAES